VETGKYTVIYNVPCLFKLDHERFVANPVGMVARTLWASFHLVLVPRNYLQNLTLAFQNVYLNVVGFMPSAYGAGLSCLTKEEQNLGSVLIDCGGKTTSLAFFQGGVCVHIAVLPVGGSQITQDISYGLGVSLSQAERLKILHGNCSVGVAGNLQSAFVKRTEKRDESPTSDGLLNHIVRARAMEIIEQIKVYFQKSNRFALMQKRIVLVGGASQLTGFVSLMEQEFDSYVRLGYPQIPLMKGLGQNILEDPAFATLRGSLYWLENWASAQQPSLLFGNQLSLFSRSKISSWIREKL
jgi:cell division protein FtsA